MNRRTNAIFNAAARLSSVWLVAAHMHTWSFVLGIVCLVNFALMDLVEAFLPEVSP